MTFIRFTVRRHGLSNAIFNLNCVILTILSLLRYKNMLVPSVKHLDKCSTCFGNNINMYHV